MKNIRWIYSNSANNFLQEQGFKPVVEESNRCAYKTCKELWEALETFQIRTYLFPNKRK